MRLGRTALLLALATASVTTKAPVVFAQTEQAVALTRFNKGRDLFIAGNYAQAVVEFRAAAELVESPNTRLYIARCEKELGHLARAYVEYQRAATEAADRAQSDPRYASTRDAAKQESAATEARLGHVTVRGAGLPKDVVITVAGSPMSAAAIGVSAPVDPGRVSIGAKAKGYKAFRKSVDVTAGADVVVDVSLEEDPDTIREPTIPETKVTDSKATGVTDEDAPHPEVRRVGGGVRVAGYLVGGVGAVGVVLFGTFAVLAQNKFSQIQNACGTRCDGTWNSAIDEGKRDQLIANASLGVGATLLVAGAIMIAAGGPKTVDARGEAISFVPILGPSPDGRGVGLGMFHAF